MSRGLEQARDHFLASWEAAERTRPAGEPGFLRERRRLARDLFAELGLPSTRLEEWRYTSLAPLAEHAFEWGGAAPGGAAALGRADLEAASVPVFACSLFVFVDGRYEPSLSAPRAVSGDLHVESLAALAAREPGRLEPLLASVELPKRHPLAALAEAFADDGAVVTVPRGTSASHPIHLVFVTTGQRPRAVHPRVLLRVEAGSRALVIQDHVSPAASGLPPRLTNALVDLTVAPGASLDYVLIQREDGPTHHLALVRARQERDAALRAHTLCLSGSLLRNDLEVLLADEGADCRLRGLFLASGDAVVDNHTLVDHAMPRCTSHEVYKGILAGRSRGVFRGRVIVRPGAVGTNARQSNPNLLLEDGAEIDSKPQLEIHADDVRCSHGSAIGRIEPEALFYLRSRGLPEADARALLTQGFAREILGELPHEALREALDSLLLERLRRAGIGS